MSGDGEAANLTSLDPRGWTREKAMRANPGGSVEIVYGDRTIIAPLVTPTCKWEIGEGGDHVFDVDDLGEMRFERMVNARSCKCQNCEWRGTMEQLGRQLADTSRRGEW